jgi:hypothetical protein
VETGGTTEPHHNSAENCSAAVGRDTVRRFTYKCPLCGRGDADATYKPGRDGQWRWFVGCWACPSEEYLPAVAEAVGAPGGGELRDDPTRWLGHLAHNGTRSRRPPAALPTEGDLRRWRRRLRLNRDALDYLRDERGLNRRTISRYGIGYGSGLSPWPEVDGFVFPVRDEAGALVNVKRRFWPDVPWSGGRPAKSPVLPGRGCQLYPKVPPRGRLLLVEGEFDALLARQHGLPAITTTCGKTLPDELAERLAGRRVVVVYDVGAEADADRTVAKLGRSARAVALRLPRERDDITDWFVTYGRSANALRALVTTRRRGGRAGA